MSDKKVTVLHLISSLELGGAEKLLVDLLKHAHDNNSVDFVVVVMNNRINKKLQKDLLKTNCKTYFLGRKQSSNNPKYILKLISIIKKHKVKIIHSHNYGSKSWSILCKILKPSLKLFFTMHCMNIFKTLNHFQLMIHKSFIDINIAISEAVLKDAKKFGVNNTVKIYNGINLKNFPPEKTKSDNSKFKLINVSRVNHQEKGQDILIKALKICKDKEMDFHCNFVGSIHDYGKKSYEYLKSLIIKFKLEDNISFLGSRNDIPNLLRKSNLFILSSRNEGLGLTILEAMSAKVPVIVSNVDGPAEIIKNQYNGLIFESENVADLANKILSLYNNKDKQNIIAENAFGYVQSFDISVMSQKYIELYKNFS